LNLIHSGDAIPNFLTVWMACALTLFNLDRFTGAPHLPAMPYLLGAVMLPAVALVAAYVARRGRERPRPVETLRQADLVAESQETEV
jgi:membrane protein implicated in regulation of membrane protease activity